MRNILMSLILLVIVNSCIADYDLKLKSGEPKLVVEGTITNQERSYLIRVTKSRKQLTYDPNANYSYNSNLVANDGVEPIIDAEVYLSDKNESIIDTLVKAWLPENIDKWLKLIPSGVFTPKGYYMTKKIKGIPGHTYALTIKWKDQEYHAESYMPPVPPLDSVQFKFTAGAIGKPNYNIPLIFFKEPQNERNYYLFVTQNVYGWPYSILSDEYLKSYVNGLDVCKGVTPDYWVTNYPYDFLSNYFIEMHSVTKETYDYYKALIQQFKTDGGGYSPSPASPPTNLDNGALGFFRASAVNRVNFTKDDNHEWVW